MEWHIITSSKGGIGKTLLALLLLAHNLDNKKKGSTLVLDLNGMNTDSSAILLYRKRVGKPINAELKREIETQQKILLNSLFCGFWFLISFLQTYFFILELFSVKGYCTSQALDFALLRDGG